MTALSHFDLWFASYKSSCSRIDAGIWQYSSSGKVDGISGSVDMDYSFRDYPAIISNAGLNGLDAQSDAINTLVKWGVITDPDLWKARSSETVTVGELLELLAKMKT